MNIEHRARQALRAMLTREQVELYQTNAFFKNACDVFFSQITPTFLTGAAIECVEAQRDHEERVRVLSQMPSFPLTAEVAKTLGLVDIPPPR